MDALHDLYNSTLEFVWIYKCFLSQQFHTTQHHLQQKTVRHQIVFSTPFGLLVNNLLKFYMTPQHSTLSLVELS